MLFEECYTVVIWHMSKFLPSLPYVVHSSQFTFQVHCLLYLITKIILIPLLFLCLPLEKSNHSRWPDAHYDIAFSPFSIWWPYYGLQCKLFCSLSCEPSGRCFSMEGRSSSDLTDWSFVHPSDAEIHLDSLNGNKNYDLTASRNCISVKWFHIFVGKFPPYSVFRSEP